MTALQLTNEYDCLIIPGTKNVMEDAVWLSRLGWKKKIREFADKGKTVFGICGGYQLLGKTVYDPHGVESSREMISGLNLLPVETILEDEKIVRKITGKSLKDNKPIKGYEIHMGQTRIINDRGMPLLELKEENGNETWTDGCIKKGGNIAGTYVHGILDSPGFRNEFLNRLRRKKRIKERNPGKGRVSRFKEYDRLADHFEKCCDVERILKEIT